ncbi:acetyl-CoA carboxylase biotin carboxyl carrier protein [Bacillus salitolerans]|uniref:Biotin carboxyl carrier protein of acetyl-CoA carboxylase n=1 Tax=Bacillus salitolerans TaxID=1437434 RepID=A0ABW4LPH6_9BACI
MLKIQEIRELIKLVDQSTIDEFSYEHDGSKIKMKKHNGVTNVVNQAQQAPAPVQVAPPVQSAAVPTVPAVEPVKAEKLEDVPASKVEDANLHKITSPMVGTFYASPNPEAKPYVSIGDKVKADSVVCIVEAMKLFNEIEAEVNGEIVEILVENGQLVEYGQPMFLVKPE